MTLTEQSRSLESKASQRRGAARHKLFEPVTIEVHGQPFRAHMLDLSCSGALGHSEVPPVAATRLIVRLVGLAMPARVIWVRAKRFGVRFDEPLPQAKIDQLLTVIGGGVPRARRPSHPIAQAAPRM